MFRIGRWSVANVLLLLCSAMAGNSWAAASPSDQGGHRYWLSAAQLGTQTKVVRLRFEYRSASTVIGADDMLVSLDNAPSIAVPIPASSSYDQFMSARQALRLFVSANGLLVAVFDRDQLSAHDAAISARLEPGVEQGVICESPCGGGCGASQDYDCDGVANAIDNCHDDFNPDQRDCDHDGFGDVCDVIDGTFQASGPVKTCMTDKDVHLGSYYFEFEHHVEQPMADVSSCASPGFWNRWVRSTTQCGGTTTVTDAFCCRNGLRASIQAVGDDVDIWCYAKRNIDYCH